MSARGARSRFAVVTRGWGRRHDRGLIAPACSPNEPGWWTSLLPLSLTTDLATGFPFERGLRACLVADGLARALELDPADHRAAFLASLVLALGCGHASENAALFGDDIAFERLLVTFDPGKEAVAGAQLRRSRRSWARRRPRRSSPSRRASARSPCEVAAALGTQLGLPGAVVGSFGDVFERWDGRGLPNGATDARRSRCRPSSSLTPTSPCPR